MGRNFDYRRMAHAGPIAERSEREFAIAVLGAGGGGKLATARTACAGLGREVIIADACGATSGYLAGFHDLVERVLSSCEQSHPEIVARHEQALKRLFPKTESPNWRIPKDLTNTSPKGERTRFYHHEYQIKLLHALFEFVRDGLAAEGCRITLILDRAERLPRTSLSFLDTLLRKQDAFDDPLRIIALFDHEAEALLAIGGEPLRIPPLALDEAAELARATLPGISDEAASLLWRRSHGNPAVLDRLVDCWREKLCGDGYFSADVAFDFLLERMGAAERERLLERYVENHCVDDDPLARRNYETARPAVRDRLHRKAHERAFEAYERGEGRLRVAHALALSDAHERLVALCGPSEALKGIGLYDSWMEVFSSYWTDPDMRTAGSGNDAANHVFVNVAFILYSLGMGPVALPFLEVFQRSFPNSRLMPTVIYAQSMTYGRYQLPVDIPRASALAELNLKVIDEKFRDLDTYEYIKIFAENALAYVRARQGRFDEALHLCTQGIDRMAYVYGTDRFKLHQSILVYNTAQIYEITRDFDLAENFYRRAIDMDPFYGEYHNDLANLLSRMESREEEALSAYAEAIRLSPCYFEAYVNRGVLLGRLGRTEEALHDFRRALDIKPSERKASLALGNLLIASGRAVEAAAELQRALRFGHSADLLNNLAVARLEASDPGGALEACRAALTLDPRFGDAYNNMAIASFELGDRTSALNHASAACRLSPDDPDYAATHTFIAESLRAAS